MSDPASTATSANVRQAVPFFMVESMNASLRFYAEGLGFTMTHRWIDEGTLRWCWLERGGAALMLQEIRHDAWTPGSELGVGVSVYFICEDAIALYHELISRGVEAGRPFVGNGMWVTSLRDPDGYHLYFESMTDAPEESEYTG